MKKKQKKEKKQKDELIENAEKIKVEEKKEGNKCGQFTPTSLLLMILIIAATIGAGCWYTYFQYNRMEEANSAPKK